MKRNFWFGTSLGVVIALVALSIVSVAGAQGGVKPTPQPGDIKVPASPSLEDLRPEGGGAGTIGTAFSYQGLLKKGGAPFNGQCDFQFKLFDAPSAGNQLGSTLPGLATDVVNGVFTVYLDFGDQFKGDYRYLETWVSCPASGSPSYTTLPRQTITPTPYALSLRPGATITGSSSTALTAISTAIQGTGLLGVADNGANAWGVAGFSTQGIGVLAGGNDNTSTPNTALKINGGAIKVGGAVRPAFQYALVIGGSTCSSVSHPLINNDPNALIFVTPVQSSVNPATDVYLAYSGGTWYLCRSGGGNFTTGMTYNFLVIKQ